MKTMQLRPRGVRIVRGGFRDGIPVSTFLKTLAVSCLLAVTGCASVAPTSSGDPAAMQSAADPITGLQPPAPLASGQDSLQHQSLLQGRAMTGVGKRLDAPLVHRDADQGLSPQVVDLTVQPSDIWTRIRRGFAVPNIDTPLVKEWEDYYAARPDYLQRAAQRAGKYLYYIVEEIDRRGLPSELALLPFVESSFDPWALSSAKASGLWQFVPSTGRGFNLKQDWWRDERRDPIASTNAALDYLQYLFDFSGDWQLALASYNWGEGSVKRAMDKQAALGLPTDYLSLDMPDETRNYIPKLQAIKNIISNPAAFNLALPIIDNQPYFVTVTKDRNIDVKLAAQLAEMPIDEFKALNPSFNRGVILGSEPTLNLPTDRIATFEANLKAYNGSLSAWHTHKLEHGDTLVSIARKYKTSVATLRKANGLSSKARVSTGDTLVVPVGAHEGEVADDVRVASTRTNVQARISARTYKVRRGDTLDSIAHKYGTSVGQLRALNHLKGKSLAVGRTLQIPGTDVRG
jgi:membrane-bound lytic murein transglycosylase D